MNASIEISLYPLDEDYKDRIIDFIHRLRKNPKIECRTNGMSSQLFGDYDELMQLVTEELRPELSRHRCMAVLKIGDGLMKAENLPDGLK